MRRAIRERLKVRFAYRNAEGVSTRRDVRPLALAFFGPIWLLNSWCELRQDFRSFRLDRMCDYETLGETFRLEPGKTLQDFLKRDSE